MLGDLRHSIRILIKSPAFTAVAIAALALGIGANTAIFTVVNAVLLRPLPYPDPDRIVRLERGFPDGRGNSVSLTKYALWRRQNQVLDHMTAYDFTGPGMNLKGTDRPEQVKGIHVSADFFPLFGATTVMGRTFSLEEDRPGGPALVVLSHGLWQRRFGGDPTLPGRPININGEVYTVVGILAQGFQPDPPADIFLPLQADPNSTNQGHYLSVAARLKAGVTLDAAKAQMNVVGQQFRRENPKWMNEKESVAVIPFREAAVGDIRSTLLILMGAVGLVLLIACANVANLLLARAASRQKEIAIRSAMGAGRWRIVRQLLTESVMLGGAGGVFGLAIGYWGTRVLMAFTPPGIPRISDMAVAPAMEWRVLLFTLGLSLLTGVLFGLVPALQTSKPDLNATLKETGGRSTTGRHNRARSVLIVSEMALALVLLICAALLIQTLYSLRSVKPGFDAQNVLTMKTSLAGEKYSKGTQVETLVTQMTQRLEALPGVQAATFAISFPLQDGPDLPINIEGKPSQGTDQYNGDHQWRNVSPHYFDVFHIPLLRGRVFNASDTSRSLKVMLINDAMSKKYFPKEDPIGRRITIGKGLGPEFDDPPRMIVGVVGDVRERGLDNPPDPVMYVPATQTPDGIVQLGNKILPMSWAVRTSMDPTSISTALQREFLAVDSQLPIFDMKTMARVVSASTAQQSFVMLLLGIFAAMALLLAAIGIYGLMSYSVEQRTHEIGIRLALGARAGDMVGMVVAYGMRLAGIGVVVGLLAAYGATRVLGSMLFGVKANDPWTFGVVALALSVVALVASYLPARRATKVDPIIALRYE